MTSASGATSARIAIALCMLVAALEGYDIQSFGVAAPRLVAEFGLSGSEIGVAGASAMAGLMIGSWVGGAMAERFGAKLVLVAATAAFGICSVATAFSRSFGELLTFRLLTGLGFGGVMPNLVAIAVQLRPRGDHAAVATLIFCGMPVGGALLALTASLLGTPLPWRTLFLIGGILPLAIAPILVWLMPDLGRVAAPDRQSLITTLFSGERWRRTAALWVAFACALILLYLLLNWLPLLVVSKGLPEAVGARAALVFNLGSVLGALLLGRSADRFGYGGAISAGAVLMILGLAIMLGVQQPGPLFLAASLLGAGAVSMQYLLYAGAPLPYPPARSIAAAGAAIGIGRLGSIAGPILAGVGQDAGLSVEALLLLMIPVAIAVAASGTFALARPISRAEP